MQINCRLHLLPTLPLVDLFRTKSNPARRIEALEAFELKGYQEKDGRLPLLNLLSGTMTSGRYAMKLWIHLTLALLLVTSVQTKTVSGDFKLNGEKSEYVFTSFAVMPAGGLLRIFLSSKTPYPDETRLKVRLYRDVEWPKYLKALTCRDKIRFAQMSHDVAFGHKTEGGLYEAEIQILMFNDKEPTFRSHYWYFTIDDCSLEEYFQDNAIPEMHYKLVVQNHVGTEDITDTTHLSGDEWRLATLHCVTLVLSLLVTFLLFMNASLSIIGKSSVHAAVLWVAAAAALDAASSLFELMHLQIFKKNGIGSYFLDAMAAHSEAVCDALLVLLLISIGSGWTLPSDVVPVNNPSNVNALQRLLQDMSKPLGGSSSRFHGRSFLGGLVLLSHILLAQWGRTYNDNFESYHDFEHLPGKLLMMSRILMGILFLAAVMQTRLKCSVYQLQSFYMKLGLLGFGWFQSLPILTWVCNKFVPYYLRHPFVYMGSALLQSGSIMLLAWLVTAHSTSYHHYSHMAAPSESSLTDQLNQSKTPDSEVRTWKVGKAKIRLD